MRRKAFINEPYTHGDFGSRSPGDEAALQSFKRLCSDLDSAFDRWLNGEEIGKLRVNDVLSVAMRGTTHVCATVLKNTPLPEQKETFDNMKAYQAELLEAMWDFFQTYQDYEKRRRKKDVQLNLRVTPEMKALIKDLAKAKGCSLTEAIEDAVAQARKETNAPI